MEAIEIAVKSLERSDEELTKALDGLTKQEMAWSPKPDCNSIAFILWHMYRVEDLFINNWIQGKPEVYAAEGWTAKLGTPPGETGGGGRYSLEQLQAWTTPDIEILQGYRKAVRNATLTFLQELKPEQLDEMAAQSRLPGTVGSLLYRLITEMAMHTGQISYLRGQQRGINR